MDEINISSYETKQMVPSVEDYYTVISSKKNTQQRSRSKLHLVIRALVITIALLVVGIGLGFWGCKLKKGIGASVAQNTPKDQEINHDEIANMIDNKEIEKYLRKFTAFPHSAGTQRNYELAEYMKNTWHNDYGIKTELIRYNVLLSYPSLKKKSAVYLITSKGKVMFKTQQTEKPVEPSENQDHVLPPFAAYSPSGNVIADVIYVNYGRAQDFQYLIKHNVTCKGKIVIVRYGLNFRGDKVNFAYEHGAVGVIVYNDPGNSVPDPKVGTYPNSKYLPCSGVQRGSFRVANGDPETPGYPSKDGIYRIPKKKQNLPKIPVYPISACDAQEILNKLNSTIPKPNSWNGGLNISYNIGPGFQKPYSTWKVRLEVHNEERRKDIYNVIGTIKGKEEPDRQVIIGNHRDAWVFGGVDPSGGTACLMEIARALGKALRTGWRPRRTILLSNWGGEEYGMIGSTEYAEEFSKTLSEEGVAYLNIDSPVRGTYSLFAKSSPMLFDVLFNAAKKVKNPTNKEETVYDQWLTNLPSTSEQSISPRIDNIATGSDYVAFNQQLGIPSSEIRYIASKNTLSYPVYHSLHDTFNYVKSFIDPKFLVHRAIAQVIIHSMLALANDQVLPMNATKYSEILTFGVKKLGKIYKETLRKNNISLEYLEKAAETFKRATDDLRKKVETINTQDVLKLRMLNDKLTFLERGFLGDTGSVGQQKLRHVIFGLDAKNSYKTVEFPGLFNVLMAKAHDKPAVEEQINIVITHIRSVARYLKDY